MSFAFIRKMGRTIASMAFCLSCTCCGVATPKIEEFGANDNDHQIAVNLIVGQISCEMGQALRGVYYSKRNLGELEFLKKWGVQFSLILTIDEKSSLNPGVSLIQPLASMQQYSTNIGASVTGEANRIDTQQRFYPITDFLKGGPRYDDGRVDRACVSGGNYPGTLFIRTDSGFRDDLYSFISTLYTKTADEPLDGQAGPAVGMSHNIKFDILTSGNITPTWKLVRVATTSSPLFSASRDRSQQVIITLGPIQISPDKKSKSLGPAAQNSQNSQELAAYIAKSLAGN